MSDIYSEKEKHTNNSEDIEKIAYIVTRDTASEILENNLSTLLSSGSPTWIVGIYFVDDGVYNIVKGARIANIIRDALRIKNIWLFVHEGSVNKRNLHNMLLEDAEIKTLADFYAHTQDADHIIAI